MEVYVALLRGVNVGGKNKVSMPILRGALESFGFKEVSTYINSGNILFASEVLSENELAQSISNVIEATFSLSIPVLVVKRRTLSEVVDSAPEWWGTDDKTVYHNTIFLIPPTRHEEFTQSLGEIKQEYENVYYKDSVIYWTADLKTFSKSRYSKIASTPMNSKVTIRNANTVKKLVDLLDKMSY